MPVPTMSWFILSLLIGLCLGSIMNMVVYRLPAMLHAAPALNLFWPPSHCPRCDHRIRWYDNIPMFSWLALRGRCRSCRAPIGRRYLLLELSLGGWGVLCAWWLPPGLSWAAFMMYGALLMAMAWIDYLHRLLPDLLTQSLLWMGLLWHLVDDRVLLEDAVVGAIAGYLTLALIYWLGRWRYGFEVMGQGDMKCLAALGAWLGWQALPSVLLLASLFTLALALWHIVRKRAHRGSEFPFGPGLALAGLVFLYYPVQL
ncbi:A24 family peptidase [Erwinia tracheiphila]|uniref:Prepilin leader peptidase/N-methyltransferase n=2 Tax=Erwinia tracheiphila TaxID=65700 RepID=A0A0M2KCA7_9GAMM|nr:A24 family peptidase [Erwinia tracheiphila]EOS93517.1 prepilin peptidase [Erwinia tracheiphila PSU-1]KKF36579.1 methyltransferase [Erwinia tracheiphila]UIA83602.1 A24 family peptidase [Erwinia tracheiphila]UIA87912.1 A24 family peptidase [Erwinia tracheiphila]UIA92187.1 A24 family peptidase [Erwinia tracheiphila]